MEFANLNLLKIKLQSKKEHGETLTKEEEGILSDLIKLLGKHKILHESLVRAGANCPVCGKAL